MKHKTIFLGLLLAVGLSHQAAASTVLPRPYDALTMLRDTTPAKADTLPGASGTAVDFQQVDVEASFKGGPDGWRQFLEKNLNAEVPARRGAPAGQYTVVVQFIVDQEGKVSDIKALTRHGYGMEQELIRIIRQSPTWEPARVGDRFVKAYRKQPITFVVEEIKKRKRLL